LPQIDGHPSAKKAQRRAPARATAPVTSPEGSDSPERGLSLYSQFNGVAIHCAYDEMADLVNVVANPRNPNSHPDRQIQLLARVIKHQGWRSPIVISKRSGFVVAGHARLKAAELLGLTQVPVNRQEFANDADEYAHLVADNRIAELADLKTPNLKGILEELKTMGDFDLDLTGFSQSEVEKILKSELGDPFAANDLSLMKQSTELEGAFTLKEDIRFKSSCKYEIPELRADKLMGLEKDQTYGLWMGTRELYRKFDNWLYMWGDASHGLPLKDTIIGFYTEDYKFEPVWFQTPAFTARFLNAGVKGVILPNYSMWTNWPQAIKIYNVYRARWLGRYWQEAGLPIIPDVDFGRLDDLDFCLEGIPVGLPAIAIETHAGPKTAENIVGIRGCLKAVIERLKPQGLLLYAQDVNRDLMLDNLLPRELHVVIVESRYARLKEIMKTRTKAI